MREIIISNEFLLGLKKMNTPVHSESIIYRDGESVYKIFRSDVPLHQLRRKEKKLEVLDLIRDDLEYAIIPYSKCFSIIDGKKTFVGCKMDYVNGNMLFNRQNELNFNIFLRLMIKISKSLKSIHKNSSKIVIGDLSFFNILIDDLLRFYFIDFDSVSVESYTYDRLSPLLSYYYEYRETKVRVNKNSDRLSMLLYFWERIFSLSVWEVSNYEFESKAERLKFLNEIRGLFNELRKVGKIVPYVPYLHEIVDEDDIAIKQINSRRILK